MNITLGSPQAAESLVSMRKYLVAEFTVIGILSLDAIFMR